MMHWVCIMSGKPNNDDHATNKKYVDDLVSGTTSFVTEEFESRDETIGALNLAINSFEADLNLKADKTDLEDYATKIYTDTAVQGAKDYSDEKFSDVNVDTSSFATLEIRTNFT